MIDPRTEKKGEINGMSFGRIMTSLLIPKDSRTNPRRILSGVAFLAFVCFFLLAAASRGCQENTAGQQEENRVSHATSVRGG